jgi:cell wall assembly regulator SMI1
MKRLFDRIHVWLAANAPLVLDSLRPGASEEAIRTAEAEMGVTLPDDVKAAYRIHDGQGTAEDSPISWPPGFLYGWEWYSVEGIVDQWRSMKDFVEGGSGIPAEWRKEPTGPVRDDWYHLAWIPLTGNMSGDYHCSDLAPAPGGDVGQIIPWWHNDVSCPILTRTFTEWLERFADQLEAGLWVVSEEYYALVEANDPVG